ncbi:MAG: hypothetical protein M3O02_11180 [Acidobacteriota bacterium]|nr:hypothetical protein [Acidobacteriota bacterium]
MRKHARGRVRSRKRLVLNAYSRQVAHYAYIQDSEIWRNWTFRTISEREAKALMACGEAQPVTREVDGELRLVGYRATTPTSWERPSPATLTFATMEAAAGLRSGRRAADEVMKFRVWALIGDTKAVCVRPRMTDDELREAEKLLGMSESERMFMRRQMERVRPAAQMVA